jgi:peptidoglycan/LPS O-acetylase OafA/YrhL
VPVQELLRIVAGDLPRPLWLALAVGVPFLVAIPSYRFIETRALAFKDRFAVKSGSRSEGALSEGSA